MDHALSAARHIARVAATPEDLDLCFEISRAAMRETVERAFGGWDDEYQRRHHAETFDPATHQLILADGRQAGVLAVEPRADYWWLSKLYLLPAFQGRGIGAAVAIQVLADAAAAGQPVALQVLRANPAALRFWRRLGWEGAWESATHIVLRREPVPTARNA